jgi:predicted nucleic acid-binding protein
VSTLYLETSPVLAWLFGEPGSTAIVTRVDSAERIVTSVLTLVESERALTRAEALEQILAGDGQRLRGMLARASQAWLLMEISAEVRRHAGQRFPVEPLRTLDAIHLSTALRFMRAYPDLEMLSLDRRILENAKAMSIPAAAS